MSYVLSAKYAVMQGLSSKRMGDGNYLVKLNA
jgi:hypothetical protein